MAQENITSQAETGTQQNETPEWDRFSGKMPPFLDVREEQKRAGFQVQFLTDKPRKETPSRFNPQDTDFWFDVVYDSEMRTWTISQISLVMELQKHKPLKHKIFNVQLVPVDDKFKEQFPKYKGKDRYTLEYIEKKEPVIKETASETEIEVEEVE